jgi:Ser/Thr protein kinase RdoA (MazF antagonist)
LKTAAPYSGLTPDVALDALASIGLRPDGRLQTLNSYENRVYQAGMEEGPALVAKFYRPARWTDAQILEEHAFALELVEREIPVVAPVPTDGRTLHEYGGFRFAVYPRRGGRSPELEDPKVLEWIGRFLGRIHAAGATRAFRERPALDIESHGNEPRAWLLESGLVPDDVLEAWKSATGLALDAVRQCYGRTGNLKPIRLHGDCHSGNVLWTDEGPHFVDLDDCRTGPAVQDLWMLLSGNRAEMTRQLADVLVGYEDFHEFNPGELALVEAMRTLRLIHYSAWIARRWEDPAFPAAFPWFGTQRYWQDRILELREQIAAMQEEPLAV